MSLQHLVRRDIRTSSAALSRAREIDNGANRPLRALSRRTRDVTKGNGAAFTRREKRKYTYIKLNVHTYTRLVYLSRRFAECDHRSACPQCTLSLFLVDTNEIKACSVFLSLDLQSSCGRGALLACDVRL